MAPTAGRQLRGVVVAAALLGGAGCSGPRAVAASESAAAAASDDEQDEAAAGEPGEAAPAPAAAGSTAPVLQVLMINGGGSPQDNYASHLAHLRQMLPLLTSGGVARERITILNADGQNPAADLATRDSDPPSFRLLEGTDLGDHLRQRLAFESSTIPGVTLYPATRQQLTRWFQAARRTLRPGDTLLIYVTDHGTENERDPLENRITLWGRQSISVRQLRALLERLDPGVRVVTLMSQCFSGGFAGLMDTHGRGGLPGGSVCGYFSSTADRPAYGCYPEAAGRDRVGHSFEFMEALVRAGGRFPEAHAAVLASDNTPDVPLRTSDVYLAELLDRAARAADRPLDKEIDILLREAWKDRARWEPEIRLLDRIGAAFGLPSPRSLAEIDRSGKRLAELGEQLETHGDNWAAAQSTMNVATQRALFTSEGRWMARLSPPALQALTPPARRALAVELSEALSGFLGREPARRAQYDTVVARSQAADQAAYRMEVRLAALLRMRAVLLGVAGRVHLATRAKAGESQAHAALEKCEAFALPSAPAETGPAASATAFPPLDQEMKVLNEVIPGFMGIRFDDRPSARRIKQGLGAGSALVVEVVPGSPAQAAGLAPGDVVLGPPGAHFTAIGQIKTWTMLLPIGRAQPVEVVRNGTRRRVSLVPAAHPIEVPEIGPPKPATPAPPLHGSSYRGATPSALAARGPYLVFFWATWCAPCKESLPEVMAFARERRVPVVAITDEGRGDLDAFFARWKAPFPDSVVSDEDRLTFAAYGVSGTPTFVLVGRDGKVTSYSIGYHRARGLAIDGWKWGGR
jgi:thiol-disulfide isomerase/thioredoxin